MVTLKELVERKDSTAWYREEIIAAVQCIGQLNIIYDKYSIKCVLVQGDASIVAVIRNQTTAKIIDKHAHRIKTNGCKMTIANFQKNNGQVFTSSNSTCEIDFEDIPTFTIDVDQDMLYAEFVSLSTVSYQRRNQPFSIKGIVLKIDMSTTSNVKRTVLHIGEENDDTSCVRVTLWREAADYGYELKPFQLVTLYDLLLDTTSAFQRRIDFPMAKSSFTTHVLPGNYIETSSIEMPDLNTQSDGFVMHKTVVGRIVAIGKTFNFREKLCQKCVIGDGNIAVKLLIKDHEVINKIDKQKIQKLSCANFEWREQTINVDKSTCCEISYENVPDVIAGEYNTLLYASITSIEDAMKKDFNAIISMYGRINSVSQVEQRTVVIITNTESKTAKITLWNEIGIIGNEENELEIGKVYTFFDLRIGKQDFKGSSDIALNSTDLTTIEERRIDDNNITTSIAKLTGLVDQNVILRIGTKRRVLFCPEELIHTIENIIPANGTASYTDERLISFENNVST